MESGVQQGPDAQAWARAWVAGLLTDEPHGPAFEARLRELGRLGWAARQRPLAAEAEQHSGALEELGAALLALHTELETLQRQRQRGWWWRAAVRPPDPSALALASAPVGLRLESVYRAGDNVRRWLGRLQVGADTAAQVQAELLRALEASREVSALLGAAEPDMMRRRPLHVGAVAEAQANSVQLQRDLTEALAIAQHAELSLRALQVQAREALAQAEHVASSVVTLFRLAEQSADAQALAEAFEVALAASQMSRR